MAELTYREAVARAITQEMERGGRRPAPDRLAVARKAQLARDLCSRAGCVQVDEPDEARAHERVAPLRRPSTRLTTFDALRS